ncbi:MAG TPA: bifunctional nicotinamidase/pyrazinamidase [Verrucomicrobiae bacterium]
MVALILVDLQNDFLPGGALAVPEGDAVVPIANRLQPGFEVVVATQDWHPANHGSFAANHPGKRVYDEVKLGGLPQTLWPVHCVQNTKGADFAPGFDRRRIQQVFQKGIDPEIDSYSGFFDNADRRSTGLSEWLKDKRVREIYIAGLATDYCVRFTAFDGLGLGLRTHVIEDACRGVNVQPGDVERALREMRSAGVEVLHSNELKIG